MHRELVMVELGEGQLLLPSSSVQLRLANLRLPSAAF
jgi:hypothetical protein